MGAFGKQSGRRARRWGASWLLVLAACGGGGGSGGSGGGGAASGPAPPSGLTIESANGAIRIDWSPVAGALSYQLYWSLDAQVTKSDPSVSVTSPPYVLSSLPSGLQVYAAVTTIDAEGEGKLSKSQDIAVATGGVEKYFPPWWEATPTQVIQFDYDPGQTSAQNGAALKTVLQSLVAGDRLEIGDGTWTVDSYFDLSLSGTATDPIWIVAQDGESPVIRRSNAAQNTLNLGANAPTRYLVLQGLEITGGSIALRLYDCENVWVDQCDVHHPAHNAITANTVPTAYLYFTRNEVHDTGGTGEGFYIGGNFASPIAHHCVIALNHVYNTAGSQGDGIEVKQGSYANWIAENVVHDTNYPAILVYGTGGQEVNLVEKNLCWNAGDNVMQVQGEAIVRNNVLFAGSNGFFSNDHQGSVRDLTVVHNTIVNSGTAARLSDWSGRPGMTFANNACYSQSGSAIVFAGGAQGVEVSGNVVYGPVSGIGSGFSVGAGLSDFAGASWDATSVDVAPSPAGALVGTGNPDHGELEDFQGDLRLPACDAGAVDAD